MESQYDEYRLIGSSSGQSEYTLEMMLAELHAGNEPETAVPSSHNPGAPVLTIQPDVGDMTLDRDVGLPLRWVNYFNRGGIYTVADLVGKDEEDLRRISGIGDRAITLLKSGLSLQGLPTLAELKGAELSNEYEPDAHDKDIALQPADKPITVGPLGLGGECPAVVFESVTLSEMLRHSPYVDQIIHNADDITLSESSELFECIPPVLRQIRYFADEPIGTLLTHTIDHCLDEFGYVRARTFYKEALAILSPTTPIADVTRQFVRTVRTGMPKVLLPARASWFCMPQQIDIPSDTTIEDLVGDDSDIVSAYIAYSVAHSLEGLFINYQTPVSLGELFAKSILDADMKYGQRDVRMISKQLGIGVEPATLESVATEYGISRQRVQQVVKKFKERYDITRSKRLLPLRIVLMAEAMRLGCRGSIIELEETLAKSGVIAHGERVAGLLSLLPEFDVTMKMMTFLVNGNPCLNCHSAKRAMEDLAGGRDVIPIEAFLQTIGCDVCPYHFSQKLDDIPLDSRLLATESIVGPRDNPRLAFARKPKSMRARVHAIIAVSGKAMSADDVVREYKRLFGESVTKARMLSHLGNFDDVMLWGRSTYIHTEYASFPKDLITMVARECVGLFGRNRTPILGAGGVYQMFKEDLSESGVPTEQALYSLLRRLDYHGLLLREYPWICDKSQIGDRTTFPKYFNSIMKSHNGYISDAEALDITQRALAQSFQLSVLQQSAPNLIHADNGTYDLRIMHIDYKRFDDLVCKIAEQMEDGELISARVVFADNRSRLVEIGIRSYEMLYRILDMREAHLPLNASRLPYLIKSDKARITVREAIRNYIKATGRPVSLQELREEFVGRRGISKSNVSPFFFAGNGVVKVGEDLYAWEDGLRGARPDVGAVEGALDDYCSTAMEKARLFYDVDQLVSSDALPDMGAMRWNKDLLSVALSESEKYRILGPAKNALVSIDLHPEVVTDEDFFGTLLSNEYYGLTTWNDFASRMERLGIATNLRPEYFASMPSIEANNAIIKLNR